MSTLPEPGIDVCLGGQRISGYTAEQVQALLSEKDRQLQTERDYAADAVARLLRAELAQRRAEAMLPLPVLARLIKDLEQIQCGDLPDGDGVSVSTALWAERWLARLDYQPPAAEPAAVSQFPGHLRVQVFTEQRAGMRVGMPEAMVKVTDLRTGRYTVGHGERNPHLNRAKAVAALAAGCHAVPAAAQVCSHITFLPGRAFSAWEPMPLHRALQQIADGTAEAEGMEIRLLYTEPVPVGSFEREHETPRRRTAVELLLQLGYTWSGEGGWRPPAATSTHPAESASLSTEANRFRLEGAYGSHITNEIKA